METRLRHSSYLAAISHHISPEGFPSLYKPKHTDKTQLLGPGFPLYKACLAKTAANLAGSAFIPLLRRLPASWAAPCWGSEPLISHADTAQSGSVASPEAQSRAEVVDSASASLGSSRSFSARLIKWMSGEPT